MTKETPIFEEVLRSLLKSPRHWQKLLIGGVLSFIPGLNFLAFGYLFRISRSVRASGRTGLPDWQLRDDWRGLFFDGLRFALVWVAFWLLPVLMAALVSWLLTLVFLGALTNVLFCSTVLYATVLFCSALYRYTMREDFHDLLDLNLLFRMTWLELPRLLIPLFCFLGLLVLTLPFYGFSFFGGFLVLITYTGLRYRSIEERRNVPF